MTPKAGLIQTEYFQGTSSVGLINLAYDATTGLVDSLTYPESTAQYRLKLKHEYDKGLLKRVKDFNVPATVFWEATTMDAYGQILDETLGNGLKTIRGFEPRTGLLNSIISGPVSSSERAAGPRIRVGPGRQSHQPSGSQSVAHRDVRVRRSASADAKPTAIPSRQSRDHVRLEREHPQSIGVGHLHLRADEAACGCLNRGARRRHADVSPMTRTAT